MADAVEIWFEHAPAIAEIAESLAAFGTLVRLGDGRLRLVEGDEPPAEGAPLALVHEDPPDPVRAVAAGARSVLRMAALLTGSRGFWLARIAAEVQRSLGGVVHVPSTGEVFADADTYEASWPSEHGGHGGHGPHA